MANWIFGNKFVWAPTDWEVVTGETTTTTTTTTTLAPLGPLGYSLLPTTTTTTTTTTAATVVKTIALPAVQDPMMVAAGIGTALQTLLLTLLGLWILGGGLWAILTHLATSQLRTELESLTFLFMPQSSIHKLSKATMGEAMTELDQVLAKLFLPKSMMTDRDKIYSLSPPSPPQAPSQGGMGPLAALLRALMLLLALASGPLQTLRHLLGMAILKIQPDESTMRDYTAWLEDMAAADMRAVTYLMNKGGSVGPPGTFGGGGFPNFSSQFLTGELAGF